MFSKNDYQLVKQINDDKWQITPNIQSHLPELKSSKHILNNNKLLHCILDNVQDGICILDKNMIIKYVNSAMHYWYSYHNEIINKKCYTIFHNRKSLCESCPLKEVMESKKPKRLVIECQTFGHTQNFHELYGVPIIDENGEIIGFFEYVRDITFQQMIEMELNTMSKRFHNLEQKSSALVQLLNQKELERENFENTIINNMEKFIKPSLQYLTWILGLS